MNKEQLELNLRNSYNLSLQTLQERISHIITHISSNGDINTSNLLASDIEVLSTTILEIESQELHKEVEALLAEKEQIERKIERTSQALQEAKYDIFNALEQELHLKDSDALVKLHQVKLQTIELYDFLGELVESAVITALEKDTEIDETITEVVKDITFEAIKEGSLNTIRIRKILSTILQSSIEVAEASPVRAAEILTPTLKGMRAGLIHAISRFKQRLAFIPLEAKHILIEDYETIIEDLHQSDLLFTQVIKTQADHSSSVIKSALESANKEMKYDLDELLRISKETAEAMKERFSTLALKTLKQADKALKSKKAQEAAQMGKQAIGIAKTALDSALKSAKSVIEKK